MTLGAYEIIEKLSDDGDRVLYRALDPKTGDRVLIRVLQERARFASDAFFLRNEFEMLSDPALQGCVRALGLENLDGYPALVMADPAAKTLRQVSEALSSVLLEKVLLAKQIAGSLSELHRQGIIHKNLNPASILIQEDTGEILLSDFGLAERIGQHREASFIGACTPEYASPEQTGRTSLALDYRSDIYSLGVVFYELFCGRRPFQGEDINGLMYAHLTQAPASPRKVNRDVPEALDEILLKMLEKEPDNRYQSLQGLLPDLEWVESNLSGQKRDVFILGRQDVPVRFVEPQKPYGKQLLMDLLTEERAGIGAGRNRLLLLKGEAGSGKSYLLQTLYRSWAGENGTVLYVDLSGISEQAPYSALRQALEAYADHLLTGPAERLRRFRSQLERPLLPSLRQLGDLFPSLPRLFPERQEPDGDIGGDTLPPLDRQILLMAEAMIGFEPPICILADGLDRIDKESYSFLTQLLRQRFQGGVLLAGTVSSDLFERSELTDSALLREGSFSVQEYTVPEYAPEDVQLYLRDAFKLSLKKAGALSRLIYAKTDGNPHHTAALIRHCCQKGWLFFNTAFGEWDFKGSEIERYQTAANVTNRALDRLKLLGDTDLEILKAAAVMGFEFDPEALARVTTLSRDTIQTRLSEAMAQGLLAGRYGADETESASRKGRIRFRFSHESIYLYLLRLADEPFRIRTSYAYGQVLAQGSLATTDELGLYLSNMNGAVDIVRPEDRPLLAQRNLEYAIRLKRIGVLERALHHAEFGLSLLDRPHFDEKDLLCFRLTLERAELAYLNRQFSEAEAFFDALIGNCTVPVNRAKAIRTKMTLYINQGRMKETIALAAEALEALDVPFDGTPSDIVVGRELLRYNALILGKRIEDMEALPVCTDTRVYLITEIYMTLISVSYLVGKNLFIYVILRILNMTLKHGLTMHSSYAFSIYGLIAGSALGNPWKGVAYGSLGIRLAERFGSQDMLGKCLFTYGFFLNHWVNHPRTNLPPLQRAIELTEATGDMVFHAYSVAAYILAQMDSGVPLTEILRTIGSHFDRIHAMHVEDVFNLLVLLRQTVYALQGQTDSPASFNAVDFDEALFEEKLKASSMQSIYAVYLVQKVKLNYLYGQYQTADSLCAELQSYTQELMGLSVFPEYYQYYSLTLLELEGTLQSRTRTLYRNQRHLSGWMQHAPQNFRHRYLTVHGVWQLKRGQAVKAVATLTEALQLAQKQGFLQEEALINELLGRCHEQLNQAMIRRMYLRNAYALYKQWGGLVKMTALKEAHSDILFEEGYEGGLVGASLTAGIPAGAQGHMADLLSVFKSAQTLSSEMHPHELFKRLLAIIRENAGAQRTVILMKQGDIVPVAWSTEAGIVVAAEGSPEPCEYAETVVNQAARSGETVIVEDVAKLAYLRKDPYVIKHSPVSLMCTPILWKGALMGLLYLENNRIAGAFSWNRLEVMQVLTAQFVISYDNALLYESLRHSESELKNHKYKLERIVEERTAELSRANFEIQLLLDHAGQGFFSFDRTERIGSELSRECTRIFGRTISGLRVSELLGSCCGPEEGALLSRVIDKAFQTSDVFQARVYLSLLPQQLQVQEKTVAVEYQMIEDFDSRRVMAILTDVTETQALMKTREEEKRQLKTIVKIVKNRNSFLRSLDDYQQFAEQGCLKLAEAGADPESVLTELFRIVHTFKGDFAQWGLIHTEQALHEIESLVAAQRNGDDSALEVGEFIEDLDFEKAVEKDLELLEGAFGKSFLQKGEHFEISRAEILSLETLAKSGDREALAAGIKALRLVNIKELLAPYDDYVATMAFTLEKKVNPLKIAGADVLIDRKHYYNLVRVLVHIFRNMMDYGIEVPETRVKAGKPEAGTIYCTVERSGPETVLLRIEDDGSGISPQQLLEVLVKNAPDQRARFGTFDDDALLQTIFTDGVSTGDDVTLLSGRGIGLSAVRAEVERLGGGISVSSQIGIGTAFTITLPLID